MGRLLLKAAEWKYQEFDRRLKEQFIEGLNIEDITVQFSSEHVLIWAQKEGGQRT